MNDIKSSKCQAKIPQACRYHGLGKTLNDDDFQYLSHRVEKHVTSTVEAIKNYFPNISKDAMEEKINDATIFCWERSMFAYEQALKSKTIPAIKNPTTEVEELTNVAIGLFNNANVLAAYKSSPFPLKAIQHAGKARNLCAYTSLMFMKRFTEEDFQSDAPLEIIRRDAVDSKKPGMFWHHAAILTSFKDKKYVVDYTMRQFNPKLAMPWVGTVEDWEKTLHKANGEQWTQQHLNKFSVQGGETREFALEAVESF